MIRRATPSSISQDSQELQDTPNLQDSQGGLGDNINNIFKNNLSPKGRKNPKIRFSRDEIRGLDVSTSEVQDDLSVPDAEHDLTTIEINRERKAYDLGTSQYLKIVRRYRENKALMTSGAVPPPELSLTRQAIAPLTALIDEHKEWLAKTSQNSIAADSLILSALDSPSLAYLTARCVIERISAGDDSDALDEKFSLQAMGDILGTLVEDEFWFRHFKNRAPGLFNLLLQGVLKDSPTYRHRRTVLYRSMNRLEEAAANGRKLSGVERAKLGVALLTMFCTATGWAEFVAKRLGRGKRSKELRFLQANPAMITWLNSEHEKCRLLSPQWQPMVVPPVPWTDPTSGGYLKGTQRIMKIRHEPTARKVLASVTPEKCPTVYRVLNALQAVPWTVNTFVLEVLEQFWHAGGNIAGLPSREPIPYPEFPEQAKSDWDCRRDWRREKSEVHKENLIHLGQRVGMVNTLKTARELTKFDSFWLPAHLDFRGRLYYMPRFNYQGADPMRALFLFAEGKEIKNQAGADWLAIHGANCWGEDKSDFETRIAWVRDHEELILASAADPFECRWWTEADSPWMFLAWCAEWAGYLSDGFEYVSHLPVAMDGTCNGLQHWAALLRDPDAGKAVNLLPSDSPQDIYTEVATATTSAIRDLLDGRADAGAHGAWLEKEAKRKKKVEKKGLQFSPRVFIPPSEWSRRWLSVGITRSITKRPVMIVPYSGTLFAVGDYIHAAAKELSAEDKLKLSGRETVDLTKAASRWLAPYVWKAIAARIPSAVQGMAWLRSIASALAESGRATEWRGAHGLPVFQAYYHFDSIQCRTCIAGRLTVKFFKTILDKEGEEDADISSRQQQTGVSPNLIHNYDAAAMFGAKERCLDQGIVALAPVHDSFATHACDCPALAINTREAFVELHSKPQLEIFLDQAKKLLPPEVADQLSPPPSIGGLDLNQVMESRYFFA